jgi:hypothetical protein
MDQAWWVLDISCVNKRKNRGEKCRVLSNGWIDWFRDWKIRFCLRSEIGMSCWKVQGKKKMYEVHLSTRDVSATVVGLKTRLSCAALRSVIRDFG